jgi:hypothetical protein
MHGGDTGLASWRSARRLASRWSAADRSAPPPPGVRSTPAPPRDSAGELAHTLRPRCLQAARWRWGRAARCPAKGGTVAGGMAVIIRGDSTASTSVASAISTRRAAASSERSARNVPRAARAARSSASIASFGSSSPGRSRRRAGRRRAGARAGRRVRSARRRARAARRRARCAKTGAFAERRSNARACISRTVSSRSAARFSVPKKFATAPRRYARRVDLALAQPLAQHVGGDVDEDDLVGELEDRCPAASRARASRSGARPRRRAFEVLDVERRHHVEMPSRSTAITSS